MIIGTGISARDFAWHLGLSPWKADIKKIYVTGTSLRLIKKSYEYDELAEKGKFEILDANVKEFKPNKVIALQNGKEYTIDIVMYATGYEYCLPFLDKRDEILEIEQKETHGRAIFPLYKKLISARWPSFNLIGTLTGSPFPLAGVDRQIMTALAICNGWATLPSTEEMIRKWEDEWGVYRLLRLPLEKSMRYNYITIDPITYGNSLYK